MGGRFILKNTGLGEADLLLLLLLEALVLLRANMELPILSDVELTKDNALFRDVMDAFRELCALDVSDAFLELWALGIILHDGLLFVFVLVLLILLLLNVTVSPLGLGELPTCSLI